MVMKPDVNISGRPLVEVRTPTYKRAALLKRALESLIAQTHQNWRCIVFDDEPGGGDARCVCEALADPRIVYKANKINLGVGKNIDQAFAIEPLPGSEYACVLEDDNYFLPSALCSNLTLMNEYNVDILLRNQLVERPGGKEADALVGSWSTYERQYREGILARNELWASFFYSTGANNSSLFWRLGRGISFSTSAMSSDPVFQERLRTLCIDRTVYVAMDPLVIWRDNGADSFRPKLETYLDVLKSQVKASAQERRMYKRLYDYLKANECLDFVFNPQHRTYDCVCERVFARCGISSPSRGLLSRRDRVRLSLLRCVSTVLAVFLAEPVRYRLTETRVEEMK